MRCLRSRAARAWRVLSCSLSGPVLVRDAAGPVLQAVAGQADAAPLLRVQVSGAPSPGAPAGQCVDRFLQGREQRGERHLVPQFPRIRRQREVPADASLIT